MNRIFKPAHTVMAVLLAAALSQGAAPAGTGASETDTAAIAKKVYPSVVRVEVRNHTRRVATGVVIDKEGYVVTTALMSPRNEKITVTTADGRTVEAEFLGFDTETQLALLKAKDGKGLPALPMGKAADLSAGSWVCVVGISPERTAALTQGIVSSAAEDRLRLNIWVTPGSSGGPVVDDKGQMVGLLRGVYTEDKPVVFQFRDREQSGSGFVVSKAEAASSGMAVAVPIDVVRDITGQIREKGKVERGWLGVSVGLNQDGRVEVAEVDPESPAGLAKLKEGDIVVQVEGKEVATADILGTEVRKRKPGQTVTLKIERDGKPQEVKVKLGEYDADQARKEMELRFPGIFPPMAPKQPAPSGKPYAWESPAPPPGAKKSQPFGSLEMRKYIGVYCNELNPELAAYFGIKEGSGLLVARLTDKGPAQKAGLQVGDVIVKVDGKAVGSVNDLIDIIQDKKKGDKVKVEFLRDKKPMSRDVDVEEEEVGGAFGSGDFRGFLESWQGYTDAFRDEIQKWQGEYGPELRSNLKKIDEEFAVRSRESAKAVKGLFRTPLKKV